MKDDVRGVRRNTLGLQFVIDTHLIDDESAEMTQLWQLHSDGFIQLVRTDVMDTELSQITNHNKRLRLLGLSSAIPEQLGVMVLDHSRLDHSVLGCDEDNERFAQVWSVLWPNRNMSTANRRDVRDAMNVWTAIRYGANAFITLDGSGKGTGILDRASAIKEHFNGFSIVTPARALAFVNRMKGRQAFRIRRGPAGAPHGTTSTTW